MTDAEKAAKRMGDDRTKFINDHEMFLSEVCRDLGAVSVGNPCLEETRWVFRDESVLVVNEDAWGISVNSETGGES